jgi:hypothetical protein
LSIDSSAACELYKKVDVAFVGRAIHVPPDRAGGSVRFRLTQALKGVAGPEVSVLNQESGMGCGYQFSEGEDYVIFAERNAAGAIDIGPCSSTVWMVRPPDFAAPEFRKEAAEAVAFARSLRRPATGGRIFGEVAVRVPFSSSGDEATKPVDGATLILQGPTQVRRTTSVSGRYEFTGLPRGTYSVSVTMPDGFPRARSARPPAHLLEGGRFLLTYEREYTRSITIGDARACGYAPFEAEFDGEIAGTVVRHDGTPVTTISVALVPASVDPQREEFYGPTVYTDERGAYRFEKLPPGRYVVGINVLDEPSGSMPFPATLYRQPGSAGPSVIELGDGTHAELGALRLPPPLAKHEIAGTVTWSDGRPLSKVMLQICEDRSGRLGVSCRTLFPGADGGFSAEFFAGRTYIVRAEAAGPRGRWDLATDQPIPPIGTSEVTVRLDGDHKGLRVVLVPRPDR